MRWGENALAVIDAVKARLESVRAGLPEGVELVTTYDRSELIRAAIATLRRTLIEEMVVVSLVIFLFLLHARSALIPILTIPIGVALAFVPMLYQGLGANIMSLGGIAVAIGAMVDASIIVVENAHKRLEDVGGGGATRRARRGDRARDAGGRAEPVLRAARDHRLVPADLRARGNRGPTVQAARLHQDVRDGLRGRALGDAHARAGGALDPRPDPRRARQPARAAGWCAATRRWCASRSGAARRWSSSRCSRSRARCRRSSRWARSSCRR